MYTISLKIYICCVEKVLYYTMMLKIFRQAYVWGERMRLYIYIYIYIYIEREREREGERESETDRQTEKERESEREGGGREKYVLAW